MVWSNCNALGEEEEGDLFVVELFEEGEIVEGWLDKRLEDCGVESGVRRAW